MKPSLIAPRGMNCGICLHFLRANNKCPGCSSGRKVNGKCIKCAIKICQERQGEYCFNCDKFPCERLKRMDKRYQEKYETSLLNNLENIKKNGIKSFIINQEKKWVNSAGTLCVHDKKRY